MENKVEFGLRNVHVAVISKDPDGSENYAEPFRLPGAVSLTMDPVVSSEPFYADDMTYHITRSDNGFEGTLNIARVTDQFRAAIFNEKKDNNGVFYTEPGAEIKSFALAFEFQGDNKATRHLFYYVTPTGKLSISSETTGESATPNTQELTIKASPRFKDRQTHVAVLQGAAAYDDWYTKVYELETTTESEPETESGE